MNLDPALERFARLARQDDVRLRLDEASLEIARIGYPELDAAPWLSSLDHLAERTDHRRRQDEGALGFAGLLNRSLFREEGFHGDRSSYYSPRNSFLNDVLDRRTGIPITLAVIYLEVARRLGHSVQGIGFPGHFLVRVPLRERELLIDPFEEGRVLTNDDCQLHLDRAFGVGVELDPRFLQPVGPRHILARILNNLKGIYLARRDPRRALAVVERLILLEGDRAAEQRDRGKLRLALEDQTGAANDLEAYLRREPHARDAPAIRLLLGKIRRRQALRN